MSMFFPQLREKATDDLLRFLAGEKKPRVPEDEMYSWLEEAAVQIASTGTKGIDSLLTLVPTADELRLRAILVAMWVEKENLSPSQRTNVRKIARRLLSDKRDLIVADAVDTLRRFKCRDAAPAVVPLLNHLSPYVIGSALRFIARLEPSKAVPLLVKALKSEMHIVRENAVDELEEMDYKPALAKIKPLLKDPNADVRQAARTAVENLGEGHEKANGQLSRVGSKRVK